MRRVARPPAKVTEEQKRLLKKAEKVIETARRNQEREEQKIWDVAQELRDADMPDVQICRRTGLNRSTLQRRLGPRENSSEPPE